MSRVHLDANVLVALSDPSLPFFATVAEAIARGDQMETSVIAWHEYARGPLLPEDQARAARLVEGRIVALTRPMADWLRAFSMRPVGGGLLPRIASSRRPPSRLTPSS